MISTHFLDEPAFLQGNLGRGGSLEPFLAMRGGEISKKEEGRV
jgi:hypothetical protein